jgi:hypothetical protein
VSRQAVQYVQSRRLADSDAERVFTVLAERTAPTSDDPPYAMGLELGDADIPDVAAGLGIDAEEFRRLLRVLKSAVPMDVLEHSDGVWEIVYGPAYTDPKPKTVKRAVVDENNPPAIWGFSMPGWERFSTWGSEEGLGHLYAQLYQDGDNRDAQPRIWITPPRYVVTTLDGLAAAIAEAIAPYEAVPPPPAVIKMWLMR